MAVSKGKYREGNPTWLVGPTQQYPTWTISDLTRLIFVNLYTTKRFRYNDVYTNCHQNCPSYDIKSYGRGHCRTTGCDFCSTYKVITSLRDQVAPYTPILSRRVKTILIKAPSVKAMCSLPNVHNYMINEL